MKIAIAQVNPTVGALDENARLCVDAIGEARARGADLVVLPELVVTGYPPRDLLWSPDFLREAARATRRIAEAARGIAAVAGTIEQGEDGPGGRPRLYNVAALLEDGRVRDARAKMLLPSYDVFHEPRWFTPGATNEPLLVAGVPIGLLVCEDIWPDGYARAPARELVSKGARLLVCISASPFRATAREERLAVARATGAPIVYANMTGAQDELIFDGASFALDARGRPIAQLPSFEPALEVVDPLSSAARPIVLPPEDADDATFRALVLGVRDYARKNRIPDAVLGLSGGIDSALVACIAREALGPEHVTALALPSRHTDPRSTEDARSLAHALGIGFEVVPIDAIHEAARATLASLLDGPGAVDENIQARARMLVLMARVNRTRSLLLGTGNKTELATGYCTLYGDMAASLGVLADLDKPRVYSLARRYDAGRGVIPRHTFERAPSAELAPGQVDPFDYDRVAPLAAALAAHVPAAELRARGYDEGEVARMDALLRRAEAKRWQMPIGLKVTPAAFGSGRMMPVTNRFVAAALRAKTERAGAQLGGSAGSDVFQTRRRHELAGS